jgi:hypothetical protein
MEDNDFPFFPLTSPEKKEPHIGIPAGFPGPDGVNQVAKKASV